MVHEVDLQMADKSSSLTLVIPSMFIDTIVNPGYEKDYFRCGFLGLPDIVVILKVCRLYLGANNWPVCVNTVIRGTA